MFGLSRNMYQISQFRIGKVILEVPGQIRILPPQPPCPPEKDIGRTNLRTARLLRFFYVQKSSAEKKISRGVGMDLNYRPLELEAGFAVSYRRSRLFCFPDLLSLCVRRGFH